MSLLEVTGLKVAFSTRAGTVAALHGIDLSVAAGETLGIVGESGSGKSVTSLAVLRLLDRAGRITAGAVRWRGEDLTQAPASRLRALRGAEIAMIFQNPRAALNPIRQVGQQIADAICAHRSLGRAEARAAALEALRQVRIREPERRLSSYPHELSGGMCQRVMIAMAMACRPALLIADEPTTGLDVTTQKAVMDLLAELTRSTGMAMILITHDLALAAQYCQRVTVMEQGRVVETAPPAHLFAAPAHPYTQRLVAASPTRQSELPARAGTATGDALLQVSHLTKRYTDGTLAVDDVSFSLAAGESLGLVGESGSGKTTISRLVCRLMDPSSGEISLAGAKIGAIPAAEFHRAPQRRDIQIVFQDPGESLNPRFTAADAIADPLKRLGTIPRARLMDEVRAAAERCGLQADLLTRYPHQLSGGQKARIGIARALAVRPKLLVLDEPTAALDVSVQAVILELLDRLRAEEGLSYLFVSHDLNVVRMLCARMIVLQHGRIVEEGASRDVFRAPRADYTRELLSAIPSFI